MQAIEGTDTATGVRVRHRALPARLQAVFFSGALAFATFVLANVDLSNASWLPFDRLPDPAKQALLYRIIGSLAIMA